MTLFWDSRLLHSILFVAVVLLTTTQIGYAQTVLEFSLKTDQEKAKIIENFLQRGYDRMAATELDGVKKSQEVLVNHRRIANFVRALFKKETSKSAKPKESLGVIGFKQLMVLAAKEVPKQDAWEVFRIYVNSEFEKYYTKSNGEWKKDFDSKTNIQQQARFELEINTRSKKLEETKFLIAAGKGDIATVRSLIINGVNVNAKLDSGGSALMLAAGGGHLSVVQELLKNGADVNFKDADFTACSLGMAKKQSDIVQALKAKGGCLNEELLAASSEGDLLTVKNLILKKADVNVKNSKGATPLILATQKGHFEIVKLLLTKGVDVNIKMEGGYTALMLAPEPEIIPALLQKGADVNAKNNEGHTALMLAITTSRHFNVRYLLTKDIDINAKSNRGTTAVMFATLEGLSWILEELIANGANVCMKDNDGLTAFDIANMSNMPRIIEILKKGQKNC